MSKITRELPDVGEIIPKIRMKFYDPRVKTPKLHRARWYGERHSNRVLVLCGFRLGQFDYRMGVYLNRGDWNIEGVTGKIHVIAWGYLPKKLSNPFNKA